MRKIAQLSQRSVQEEGRKCSGSRAESLCGPGETHGEGHPPAAHGHHAEQISSRSHGRCNMRPGGSTAHGYPAGAAQAKAAVTARAAAHGEQPMVGQVRQVLLLGGIHVEQCLKDGSHCTELLCTEQLCTHPNLFYPFHCDT